MSFITAANGEVIDIGGSKLTDSFEQQLPRAFAHEAYFPKEIAYTSGMDKWVDVAGISHQTCDEIAIIEATCADVVSKLPSNHYHIIDLGAADSAKYEPYVRALLAHGKQCTYVALDISRPALASQVERAASKFPGMRCLGLWGNFEDGDKYFQQIPSARLFLSMGSIFYNGPDEVAVARCQQFRQHLAPADCLIVGQDSPAGPESGNTHASYQSAEFDAFLTSYLEGIQALSGIEADAKQAWATESQMINSMHFFKVVAQQDLICKKFGDFLVKKGTSYQMFESWKRDEADIHQITKQEGLKIMTLGKAKTSGMKQYLVQAE